MLFMLNLFTSCPSCHWNDGIRLAALKFINSIYFNLSLNQFNIGYRGPTITKDYSVRLGYSFLNYTSTSPQPRRVVSAYDDCGHRFTPLFQPLVWKE